MPRLSQTDSEVPRVGRRPGFRDCALAADRRNVVKTRKSNGWLATTGTSVMCTQLFSIECETRPCLAQYQLPAQNTEKVCAVELSRKRCVCIATGSPSCLVRPARRKCRQS